MGVKLQLVLGVVLVFSVCASPGSSNFRQIRQVSSDNAINSTTPQDVALEKSDRHRNLIEKSPKTDTELKNVNTNTQKNFTSIKLNKSEPHVIPPSPSEGDSSKIENLPDQNVVERVQFEDNKENTIKKDTNEKKREENSRAIDIDIAKYVSPEFHNKNNVFTMPISSDTEKYIEKIFEHGPATQKLTDFSKLELTTPRNDFFDNKFKEAVQSIDQKLEHIDVEDNEDDESSKELQVEKIIEEYKTTPNSNLDYKELNVVKNNTVDKNSTHKDMTVEQVKRINFETSFNDTKVYTDEDDPEEKKGDSEKLEPTTPKNNFILTTRKSVTLTKPPSNRNNSHILSNKIETDILKAIHSATTESPTTKKIKGDDDSSATSYEEVPEGNSIIRSTYRPVTEKQIVGESRVKIPETTTENYVDKATTGSVSIAANTEEHLTPKVTRETTTENLIRSTVDTIAAEDVTTDTVDTTEEPITITATEEGTTDVTTTFERETEPITEELTTTTGKVGRFKVLGNSEDDLDTTTEVESVTATKEDLKLHETTYEIETGEETTTYREGVTTYRNDDQTTETEIRTETGIRTSKGLAFDYLTTTESVSERVTDHYAETMSDTTEYVISVQTSRNIIENPEATSTSKSSVTGVSTINKTVRVTIDSENTTSSQEIIMHTSSDYAETTTIKSILSAATVIPQDTTTSKSSVTGVPTINKAIRVTIGNTTSTSEIILHSSPAFAEDTTSRSSSSIAPRVIKKPTTPDDLATDEHANETIDSGDASPTTIKSTFIDIDTFYPETLNPSFSYPAPDVEEPKETTKSQTSTIINATTEDGEEGTEVSGTEEIVTDSPGSNKGTIAAIVISTVGAVCLVLLAGLLYIMRKRQKRFNYGQRCRPVSLDHYSMDNVSIYNSVRRKGASRASKRSYGNPAFDDPVAVTHPLNFPALAKFAVNAEDIKAEFEEIPQIATRTSELPEGCETKNRYANVIPLPETRVFLKPIDGYSNSDYINANYVTGPKNTKGYYIACQAPLQNTVDDFWRMVWEQQTKVILMITHLFENGVEKCVDYLPPSEVLDCHRLFGDFQITLKNREVKDKYIISSLQLKNMVSNSWREVTHFWYMGWPEKGVPSEANSLIAFLIEARSLMKSSTLDKDAAANGSIQNGMAHNDVNPVVVHCSPGTGRTGVVIACDIAIREFEQTRLVDIPKIVYRIRRDRASAVQTKEQYMFIYKVVSLYATKLTGGALDSF